MCTFPDKVRQKRVSFSRVSKKMTRMVPGDTSCRYSSDTDWETLLDYRCVSEEAVGGEAKVCPYSD